jgi:hypothetical protein
MSVKRINCILSLVVVVALALSWLNGWGTTPSALRSRMPTYHAGYVCLNSGLK